MPQRRAPDVGRDALRAEVQRRYGLKAFAVGALDEQFGDGHPVPSPMPGLASAAGSAKEWRSTNFLGTIPRDVRRPAELVGTSDGTP